MVIADFSNTNDVTIYTKTPLFQYDKGQHLNILGLNSDNFYQAEFVTDISDTIVNDCEDIDNGFRISIPDTILSESGHYKDYWINVYISFSDGDDIVNVIRAVKIYVKFISDKTSSLTSSSNIVVISDNINVSDDDNGNVVIGG